ncbi:MAG: DUF1735 domain-containing protein [Pedobacter agri]
MKAQKNISSLLLIVLTTVLLLSCEKNDQDQDYGDPKIFIPQSLTSGSNLNYFVPKGLDSASRNYIIDVKNNQVIVLLGVYRSGKVKDDSYSVNISTRPDTVNTLIASNLLTNTVLLPEGLYKLPSSVTVPDGKNATSFYLAINSSLLKANYSGKRVALAVAATNASKFSLSPVNNIVIVIIDVNALKL